MLALDVEQVVMMLTVLLFFKTEQEVVEEEEEEFIHGWARMLPSCIRSEGATDRQDWIKSRHSADTGSPRRANVRRAAQISASFSKGMSPVTMS